MKDRLIELIGDLPFSAEYEKYNSVEWAKHFADYLIANGVIVPPCKVGDKVYEIHNENPFEEELQVMESKVECFFIGTSLDIHRIDGKTVFLTREEAEKALQRKEDEGK